MDIGSSFLPGEVTAVFLYAQMESCTEITRKRIEIWDVYDEAFSTLEQLEAKYPKAKTIYCILDNARYNRARIVIDYLKTSIIKAVFLPHSRCI
jgi:dTDP-4-amino-4,6-dideoxygalactose transaminase